MNVFLSKRRQNSSSGATSPDTMSTNPPDMGVDISSTDYASRRRELMKMMADLKSMGCVFVDLTA
jgi:hypothetical protein